MRSFQKGPPPEKAKLKRWWTYLSQFRFTVHHIPGIKNELSDYISRNNFDALIGESSEALPKEAFQRMDVQLDLSMRTAGILEGWSLTDYQPEYKEILQTLSTGLEPCVIDGHQWYKINQYLFYEDRIVVPEAQLDGCLQWSHLSSGHTGAHRSVDFFRECFYSSVTLTELRSRMQTIVDACGCHASKQSDSRVHTGEQDSRGPGHRTHDTAHRGRHNGEQEPSGPGHSARNNTQRACTPVNRDQAAQDTAPATPHTERARRRAGAGRPRKRCTQHHTQGVHSGEQEPGGPGRRKRNTTHGASTPVSRSQGPQDTEHATGRGRGTGEGGGKGSDPC